MSFLLAARSPGRTGINQLFGRLGGSERGHASCASLGHTWNPFRITIALPFHPVTKLMNKHEPPLPSPGQSSAHKPWMAIGLLCLVFALGIVIGAGGTVLMIVERIKTSARSPETAGVFAEKMLHRTGNQIDRSLKLTPEQSQAVREELDVTLAEIRELRISVATESRAIASRTIQRIESRLPPDKQAPFREMADKKLEQWSTN